MELYNIATRHPDGTISRHYEIRPPTPELRALVAVLGSWSDSGKVDAAVNRHGYGNTDIGCGVEYPESDEAIPAGSVRLHTFWGPPDGEEFIIPERLYLQVLELWLFLSQVNRDPIAALLKTMDAQA